MISAGNNRLKPGFGWPVWSSNLCPLTKPSSYLFTFSVTIQIGVSTPQVYSRVVELTEIDPDLWEGTDFDGSITSNVQAVTIGTNLWGVIVVINDYPGAAATITISGSDDVNQCVYPLVKSWLDLATGNGGDPDVTLTLPSITSSLA